MKCGQWVDAKKQKPKESRYYSLCMLDFGDRQMPGWWTGLKWDGLNYHGQEVKRWKHLVIEHDEL